MIRQLRQFNLSRLRLAGGIDLAISGFEPRSVSSRGVSTAPFATYKFPPRPDASAVSDTIPLFYIGRSQSEPAGCAMMFLAEPIELDIDNQGSRCAGPMSTIEKAARRAPVVGAFLGSAVAAWRRFAAYVSHALASERRHRAAIEHELFGDQYRLTSKNDDDLPVVR
jgi:hypothetical protein